MDDLAFVVFSVFEDDRIQPVAHPAYCQMLLGNIDSPVEPVRPREDLPDFLETNTSFPVRSETLALSRIEAETHLI
jgi:hypothetical protein